MDLAKSQKLLLEVHFEEYQVIHALFLFNCSSCAEADVNFKCFIQTCIYSHPFKAFRTIIMC